MICNPASTEPSDTDTVHTALVHEDAVCRLKFPVPRSYSCDLTQSRQLSFSMESPADTATETSEKASLPVSKGRRFSLRAKRSFDDSFELVDEGFFSKDRRVGALQGHHFACFSTDGQSRCGPPKLIDLVEDQCVDCLDADNPDCWVVRAHSTLIQSLRLQRRLKRESELVDSPSVTEVSDVTLLCEPLANNGVEVPKTVIGRVNSASLSRNLKGVLKRKRDPRELFREEVISISNKQQEAKMKRR
ncbi:hypothetical protein PHET_00242 [Paragonimus heterotremus]|uniref:Uncharacterized protein n=1 Tax=Paragonimus heterotremus TaxID=100268 RepID=A0A8J4TQ37_9TREM|nr:hypothetical protein PHET_00242 [Paragonimus heterotremus]